MIKSLTYSYTIKIKKNRSKEIYIYIQISIIILHYIYNNTQYIILQHNTIITLYYIATYCNILHYNNFHFLKKFCYFCYFKHKYLCQLFRS